MKYKEFTESQSENLIEQISEILGESKSPARANDLKWKKREAKLRTDLAKMSGSDAWTTPTNAAT